MDIRKITQDNFNIEQLSHLLMDAVDSGASIGFLAPLDSNKARKYWQQTHVALASENCILLGAFESGTLVGSIQLECSVKENGRHRAEVQKLFVLRSHRGKGIAKQLMAEIEKIAKELHKTLLILDTKLGDVAEQLYEKIGYTKAGIIPNFAENSGGGFSATVFFYKELSS